MLGTPGYEHGAPRIRICPGDRAGAFLWRYVLRLRLRRCQRPPESPMSYCRALDRKDNAVQAAIDRREGYWTRLELLQMDARFCEAVRRAHLELEPAEPSPFADPERRRRPVWVPTAEKRRLAQARQDAIAARRGQR
jgi:hypothetical protein